MKVVTSVSIGRDPNSNDYVISDPMVSSKHAEILHFEDGTIQINDLGSTNGTFVNGHKVSTMRLEDGDMVRVGGSAVPWRTYFPENGQSKTPVRNGLDSTSHTSGSINLGVRMLNYLQAAKPWIKFVAIFGFVMSALSLITAIYAFSQPLMWDPSDAIVYLIVAAGFGGMAIPLFQMGSNLSKYFTYGEEAAFEQMLKQKRNFFVTFGIIAIVLSVLLVAITIMNLSAAGQFI